MSAQPRTWTAIAVSTALHGAVLGALLSTARPASAPTPLAVRLLSLSPGLEDARLEATLEVENSGTPKAPLPRAISPKVSRPKRRAAAFAVEGPGPPAASNVSVAGSEAERAAATSPAVSEGGGAGHGELEKSREGSPLGVGVERRLGELHRRLAEAAARCYPAAARRFRLTGEVPLRFCLDARGAATAVSLEGSTGSPLLDRSALECVVPGATPLSGFEGCFLVPVHFGG